VTAVENSDTSAWFEIEVRYSLVNKSLFQMKTSTAGIVFA